MGKIVGVRGIRGEVKVVSLTDDPERFSLLDRIFVETDDGCRKELEIEWWRKWRRHLSLKFREIDRVEDAEALVGGFILIPRDQVVSLPEGMYYIFDLVGMEVETEEGRKLGHLREVMQLPAHDVYVVTDGTEEWLIPAVREFVRRVDLVERSMTVRVIEGLGPPCG